ncbi:MAG TPA: hemolysin family protein [Terriglobales bacterium]|nr:hemolysin family protein [Terriglobales bacterium]
MIAYVLLRVFVILLLVAANAFFAAAEFALVSVRETRIQQLIAAHRVGARTVLKLHQQLGRVVNGVQLGITVTSLTLGWLGEPVLARLFEGWIGSVPYALIYAHAIAVPVAFAMITCLHVILGELVPKSLALQRAERVALAVAAPMDVFLTITAPLTIGMSRAAGFVLRAFGTREIRHGSVHSPDELKLIVTAAHHSGQLSPAQEEMLLNALELDNIAARQVMVPRTRIFSLPSDLNLDEALSRVVDEQHSRIPVYDPQRGPEHIVGVLYAKDLMRWTRLRLGLIVAPAPSAAPAAALHVSQMKIGQIMHDVLVVPETKSLLDLLGEFQQHKRHLAVVVDEFGSTAGVISVEDVLEQLVGELEDEFDVASTPPAVADANAPLVLDGTINIRDLEAQYELKLPQDEGYETLAGFLLSRLQKMPAGGEAFDYEGRRFVVEKMDGHRIATVRIEPVPAAPPSTSVSPASVQRAGD